MEAQRNAPTVEEIAYKQVSRGPFSFRYATPTWYSFSMHVARNWRVSDAPAEIEGATVHIPSSMATEAQALKSTYAWVKEAQAEGFGVVALFTDEPRRMMMVKTKRAEIAEQITELHPSNFVLNEPRQGWVDLDVRASGWVFPLFAAMGLVGSLTIMEISK